MGLDVVITGANRGIGLGFTEEYLSRGNRVIATYRSKDSLDRLIEVHPGKFTSLQELQSKYPERLKLQPLDVTSEEDVARFAASVEKLDLLILNAGIKGYSVPGTKTKDHPPGDLRAALEVNTLAANHIWSCFFPLISKTPNAGVIFMGSLVGLPKDNASGNYHPYRVSKTASHHMMWNLFIHLTQEWRQQTVEALKEDPSLCSLKERVRTILPDSSDLDQSLEIIERALMATPLMPQLKHPPLGASQTAAFKEWLDSVFPDVPLKTPLSEKILKNLIQHPWSPKTTGREWILEVLEKTCLIDALREPIEKALTSPSSIETLYKRHFEASRQDLAELQKAGPIREPILKEDVEEWVKSSVSQISFLSEELKDRLIEVMKDSPCLRELREKMMRILSESPFAAAVCAGWVRTDMGGPHARLSIEMSTGYMADVIEILRKTKQANGLLMYDGTMAEKYPASTELEEIFYAIKHRSAPSSQPSESSSSSCTSSST